MSIYVWIIMYVDNYQDCKFSDDDRDICPKHHLTEWWGPHGKSEAMHKSMEGRSWI